jgi:hypothetical protein
VVDAGFCAKLPTKPLGNWLTGRLELTEQPGAGGAGIPGSTEVECKYSTALETVAAVCQIDVVVQTYPSSQTAEGEYMATQNKLNADNLDLNLKGYGDLAYGSFGQNKSIDGAWNISGYQLVVLKDNLVLTVGVDLWRTAYVSKPAMQPRVGTETKAVLAAVPRA